MKRTLITGLLMLATCNLFWAANSKLSPELQAADPSSNVQIIVQYAPPTPSIGGGPVVVGAVVSTVGGVVGLVGNILTLGGKVTLVSNLLNVVVCSLPASQLQNLANSSMVSYISPDRKLSGTLDYTAAAVNAQAAWQSNWNGAGIGVAIIDSGIAPSSDLAYFGLASRIVYTQDFTGGDGSDQYGHGTHVAGIVGANGIASHCPTCTRSLVGMAPKSSLINLRVLDANGNGSDSAVIAALEQAVRLKNVYNIRVINLSVGRPVFEKYSKDPLCQAVEAAWRAGIVVVAAAGNDGRDNSVGNNGYGTIVAPGNDPYVITVGAMKAMGTYSRTDDLVASYSSKGPTAIDQIVKPDIVAPGNHIVSLAAAGSTLAREPNAQVPYSFYQSSGSSAASSKFLMLNGTSMATPVVSGVVADLLQAHPGLTPDQVKARLMKTAYKTFPQTSTAIDPASGQSFTSAYDIFTIGAGYLDTAAALANSDIATGNALSPEAKYNPGLGTVSLKFDAKSTWNDTHVNSGQKATGTAGVWSTQAVWGSAVTNPQGDVWGQTFWGPSALTGFRTVWGTSGIWGDRTVWGTSGDQGDRTVWGTDSTTSDSDTIFTTQPQP